MLWYNAAIRGAETSYILVTRQKPVEMSMLIKCTKFIQNY